MAKKPPSAKDIKDNKKKAAGTVSRRVPTASLVVQPPPPSWFRRDWLWEMILILSVALSYVPVWKAGFVWDDNVILTINPCIIGPLGLKEIWASKAADICPLTLTTFWVEHAFWGLNPIAYHLVNVLLQGLSAVLLWRVLKCLRVEGAWLGAALWALHPVMAESVAWVTEMKNTESGLFFLCSILFFVEWLRVKESGERSAGGGLKYGFSLLFAALAMAAKSSTVILPFVLWLCAWWIEGRLSWRHVRRTVPRTVPFFLIAIAAGALAMWTQGLQLAEAPDPQWSRTWPERIAAAGETLWFYLGKLLFPHPLMVVYPRWQTDAGQWISYLPLLAAVVLLSILWLRHEAWSHACFFAFAYFVVALLPAMGLLDNTIFRISLVFDHLQYLASIGPLALAGAGLAQLSGFVIPKKPALLARTLCACLLLILGMTTWERASAYESDETFWTDAVLKNPGCLMGYNNLGNYLLQKGRLDEAIAQCQKALEINSTHEKAHYILGLALFQKGQVDEAVWHYQKAVEINPNNAAVHNSLGLALFQKGQAEDSFAQYQKALAINPNHLAAHYNFGNALVQEGRLDEAIGHFQDALKIQPDYAPAHINLGNTFFQEGKLDEAIGQFQEALKINLEPETLFNLGNALLRKERLDEAIEQFQKALKITPNSFPAHYTLGVALAQKGQLNEAIEQFKEALRLQPDFSPAQDALEKVQAFLRQRDGN
jgi:protein O-mannosyl-transferase